MLDHLDTLDDVTPPAPDAAMLARVRGRADRRRRRNRFTATGACVVALAVVVGTVAVVRDRGQRLDVITPATTPTTGRPAVSQATLPNGLHAQVTVDDTSVVLGQPVRARIDVRNDTGKIQSIGRGPSVQCVLGVQPSLRDSRGDYSTTSGRELTCLHNLAMPAGRTASFPVSVSTEWLTLPEGSRQARCELVLLDIASFDTPRRGLPEDNLSPAIPIEVAAPDVTARLEVLAPTSTEGGLIRGTIVFDNSSNATIDAGCVSQLSYRVALAADDLVLNPHDPLSPIGPSDASCRNVLRLLPPGISRFKFSVWARYDGCSGDNSSDPARPRCTFRNGIPQTPPLPAGRYEVSFEGRGPLGSIAATPVPIQVRSGPAT